MECTDTRKNNLSTYLKNSRKYQDRKIQPSGFEILIFFYRVERLFYIVVDFAIFLIISSLFLLSSHATSVIN